MLLWASSESYPIHESAGIDTSQRLSRLLKFQFASVWFRSNQADAEPTALVLQSLSPFPE